MRHAQVSCGSVVLGHALTSDQIGVMRQHMRGTVHLTRHRDDAFAAVIRTLDASWEPKDTIGYETATTGFTSLCEICGPSLCRTFINILGRGGQTLPE